MKKFFRDYEISIDIALEILAAIGMLLLAANAMPKAYEKCIAMNMNENLATACVVVGTMIYTIMLYRIADLCKKIKSS